MKIEQTVKKVTAPAAKFGAGVAGLVIGNIVVSKIPDLTFLAKVPVVGNFLSKVAPGVAVMFLALLADRKFKNDLVQSGAFALGLVGFINAVKRLTAGGADGSLMARVHGALPTGLGGVSQGHAVNAGHYPPTHWTESNAAYDRIPGRVEGLGNAYSLEGPAGSSAFKLEGLGNAAYLLEGAR